MSIQINNIMLVQTKDVYEFKLMVASDFHYNRFFKKNNFTEIGEIISEEKPDCLIIPGDLVSPKTNEYDKLSKYLNLYSNYTKTIITLGDTDFKNKNRNNIKNLEFFKSLENNNIKLFKENSMGYYSLLGVNFYGYSPNINKTDSLEEQLRSFKFGLIGYLEEASIDENLFNVLITHDVRNIIKNWHVYGNYILKDIDLIISGNQGLIPLDRYIKLREKLLIISRGIRSINQFNSPEVDIIKIRKLNYGETKSVCPSFYV